MNSFDRSAVLWINSFAQHSTTFDRLVVFHTQSTLLEGALAMAVFWWAWFRPRERATEERTKLVATLAGAFLSFIVGRLLALTLPFRARPIHNPELHLILPFGANVDTFRGWSAFPSDHAMLFVALAVGISYVSRLAGVLLLIHAAIVVCLPRIFLGPHYPTDILAGALIGALTVVVLMTPNIRATIARPVLAWLDRSPSTFYAALFLMTLEMSSMLGARASWRELLKGLLHHGRGH
jgi:undecaprenyl-diphosphatase